MLAGLNLGQQLLDDLLHLSESRNERFAVHIVIFHDIDWVREQFLRNRRAPGKTMPPSRLALVEKHAFAITRQ